MVLYVRHVTINTMILAGFVISVGVVVDDAIIDIENITRRLRQWPPRGQHAVDRLDHPRVIARGPQRDRLRHAHRRRRGVAGVLHRGLSGAFFQPLVMSYGLGVLASLVVALTVTPALAYILLRNAPIERQRSPITRRLQDGYARVVSRILRSTRPAFVTVGLVSMVGLRHLAAARPVAAARLQGTRFPDALGDGARHVHRRGDPDHDRSLRTSCASIPGVRNCGSHIGQAFVADEPYGVEFGENWISIDPAVDYDKTHAAVLEVVNGYPGLRRDVQTYLKERIREVLTGSSDAIVVRIYGPDLASPQGPRR